MGQVDGVGVRLIGKVARLKCEVTEGEGESGGVLQSAVGTAAEVLTRTREARQAWLQHHLGERGERKGKNIRRYSGIKGYSYWLNDCTHNI